MRGPCRAQNAFARHAVELPSENFIFGPLGARQPSQNDRREEQGQRLRRFPLRFSDARCSVFSSRFRSLGLRTFLLMRCSRTKHYGDGQYICREPWVEICALILTSCHDLDGGQDCASTLQEEQHLVHPIPHQAWFCSWDLPEPTVLSSLWEDFRWKPGG